jgi:hypothetical protein
VKTENFAENLVLLVQRGESAKQCQADLAMQMISTQEKKDDKWELEWDCMAEELWRSNVTQK